MAEKARAKRLRCPVCGKVLVYWSPDPGQWHLKCEDCWFQGPWSHTKPVARESLQPFLQRIQRDRAIAEAAVEYRRAFYAAQDAAGCSQPQKALAMFGATDKAEATLWALVDAVAKEESNE